MLRSTLATFVSGSIAGISTGVVEHATTLQAALAALLTAGAVALSDYVARRRQEARHEAKFLAEHRKTRAAVLDSGRIVRGATHRLSRRIPRRRKTKDRGKTLTVPAEQSANPQT